MVNLAQRRRTFTCRDRKGELNCHTVHVTVTVSHHCRFSLSGRDSAVLLPTGFSACRVSITLLSTLGAPSALPFRDRGVASGIAAGVLLCFVDIMA